MRFRENSGNPPIHLLAALMALTASAQPGREPFRSLPAFLQDYSSVAKPDPFDATQPLETRARSYLDSRCSYCHHPGGVKPGMDLRYATPLARTDLFAPSGRTGPDGRPLFRIHPGNAQGSDVYIRLASVGNDAMPPTGKAQVDQEGLALIRDWIQSLSPESRSRAHPPERKAPHLHDLRHPEMEIGRIGSDSTREPVVVIFDASGGRLTGYSLSASDNPRRPGWILRFSQAIPRGRYWMKLRWDAGETTRVLLVL